MMQRISSHKKKLNRSPAFVNRIGTPSPVQIFQASLTTCISCVLFSYPRQLIATDGFRRLTTRKAAAYFSFHENKDF
jgi:hypothetical protein